ncbi:MAG: hypothetical protein ACHP7D_07270 [Lysobacterales bacterium]
MRRRIARKNAGFVPACLRMQCVTQALATACSMADNSDAPSRTSEQAVALAKAVLPE